MYDTTSISRALVSIGGRGTRLRASGLTYPSRDTKSFLRIAGQPALYWTLSNLRRAGVSDVVLAAEVPELLERGKAVALSAGFEPSNVQLFQDGGRGVHGLPRHASHLLGDRFLFEAGHGMAPATHYRRLMRTPAGRVGYSAFEANPDNTTRTVVVHGERNTPLRQVVALPYCLDAEWSTRIQQHGYDITRTVSDDLRRGRASFVYASFPPEFDQRAEYRRAKRRVLSELLAAAALRWILTRQGAPRLP